MIVTENSLSIVRVIEGNIHSTGSTGNHRTWGSINCNFPFHPSIESRLPAIFCSSFAILIFHVASPWRWEIHSFWNCGLYTQYHWIWRLYTIIIYYITIFGYMVIIGYMVIYYYISLDLGVLILLPLYPHKKKTINMTKTPSGWSSLVNPTQFYRRVAPSYG